MTPADGTPTLTLTHTPRNTHSRLKVSFWVPFAATVRGKILQYSGSGSYFSCYKSGDHKKPTHIGLIIYLFFPPVSYCCRSNEIHDLARSTAVDHGIIDELDPVWRDDSRALCLRG